MPSKAKVLSALMLAACGLGATVWLVSAGASESKPGWVVEKGEEVKALGEGESEALSAEVTTKESWVFEQLTGSGITVACTSLEFVSSFGESKITGPKGINFRPLLFEGCQVTAPERDTECEVKSPGFPNGKIRSQALGFAGEEALEGSSKTPYVRWRPESTRQEIVTIVLEGESCEHPGNYEVAGLLVAKIDTPNLSEAHVWEFTTNTGTRLFFGEEEALFTGSGEFTLSSGNKWGDA